MLPIPNSKVAVPALPGLFLPRPRLLAALGQGDKRGDQSVTLVCAPSGFGKTALLSHWAHTTAGTQRGTGVAWLDLDPGDDDSRRLSQGVLAALTAHPRCLPTAPCMSSLGSRRQRIRTSPTSWMILWRRSARCRYRFRWFCTTSTTSPHLPRCGFSRRSSPPAQPGCASCCAAAGTRRCRWTRCGPRVSCARFAPTGCDSHPRSRPARCADSICVSLLRRSQPFTLARAASRRACLAGAALRSNPDVDAFLARFAATDRLPPDFLVEELLAALPAGDRKILTAVSLDESLAGSLATVIPDTMDAGPVLDRLASEMGLVTHVGAAGDRYRLNPLLADYLRAERAHRPQVAADLHARAARWWAAHDDAVAAVGHATRTGDHALLIDLMHRFTGALLVRGEHR